MNIDCTTKNPLCRPFKSVGRKVLKSHDADVAKLVDARDLKSLGLGCTGSTPVVRTKLNLFAYSILSGDRRFLADFAGAPWWAFSAPNVISVTGEVSRWAAIEARPPIMMKRIHLPST
jgi:hypothetical protein